MSGGFSESVVEDAALAWFEALGYAVVHSPDIAAGKAGAGNADVAPVGECICAVHKCPHHVHHALMMEHE